MSTFQGGAARAVQGNNPSGGVKVEQLSPFGSGPDAGERDEGRSLNAILGALPAGITIVARETLEILYVNQAWVKAARSLPSHSIATEQSLVGTPEPAAAKQQP